MSEWIRIRVKDFYKDAIGETEYTYVTREVYEALTETFRKEAHAQQMRDLRHMSKEGYTEGATEEMAFDFAESLEDVVIRQMELEILQKAMQSLTDVQKERLHLYFFEVLWSSFFVTLMAKKIGGLQFGIYRSCQISSRVFHTAVASLPLTKANRSDFE